MDNRKAKFHQEVINKQNGLDCDDEFIAKRIKSMTQTLIRKQTVYVTGYEHEDLQQEGYAAFLHNLQNFDPSKSDASRFFYYVILKRLYTILKQSQNNRNEMLNGSASMDMPSVDGQEGLNFHSYVGHNGLGEFNEYNASTERIFFAKDFEEHMGILMSDYLTEFEERIIQYRKEGYKYEQISNETGRDLKSIDNAIQRIHNKYKKYKEAMENNKEIPLQKRKKKS